MRHCPDVGAWRAHLDGESPIDGGDVHLASCRECAATLAELRGAAGFARARLAVLDRTEKGPPTGVVQVRRTRTPSRWKGVAAAALAIVFLMTPFGQTAAQAFLDAFRVERFDLVQVSAAEAVQAADALELASGFPYRRRSTARAWTWHSCPPRRSVGRSMRPGSTPI